MPTEAFRDGWFHTGDLARMDADGYLYIIDRKKDMVVTGGYKVYCKEVEQVLAQHPDIAEAAVVGVPDPLYGEALAAYIELRPGAQLSAEGSGSIAGAGLRGTRSRKRCILSTRCPGIPSAKCSRTSSESKPPRKPQGAR